MLRDLRPYLGLVRGPVLRRVLLGLLLACLAFSAAAGLVGLAGWFITASALAGLAGSAGFLVAYPSAGVRAFAAARTVLRYGERVVNHRATFTLLARLRVLFFEKALRLPPRETEAYRSGDLLDRVTADVDAMDNALLRVLVPTVSTAFVAAGFVAFLAFHSAVLALPIAAGLLVVGVLLPLLFARLGRAPGERLVHARSGLRTRVVETLEGLPEIRSYGANALVGRDLGRRVSEADRAQRRARSLDALGDGLGGVAASATVLTVLFVSIWLFSMDVISGPIVAMACLLTIGLLEGAEALPSAYRALGHTREAAGRLGSILGSEDEAAPGDRSFPVGEALIVRDLCFRYDGRGSPVLDRLDALIPSGSLMVVEGPSGSGKSTLLKLLARELRPTHGEITFGDTPLSDVSEESFRGHLGFVSQNEHVFDATIRENLLISDPAATDAEIHRVLEVVDLVEMVDGLEDGLATRVGAHGRELSGGQARRLCLARVLLRRPDVLLLDEPTSGVDRQTAGRMMAGVRAALPDATILVATHEPAPADLGHARIVL